MKIIFTENNSATLNINVLFLGTVLGELRWVYNKVSMHINT